mgnify:CR=1 FL=1
MLALQDVLHPCLKLTAEDALSLYRAKMNGYTHEFGRILYGLNYGGRQDLYDRAPGEIRNFYDNLAISLRPRDLLAVADAIKNELRREV